MTLEGAESPGNNVLFPVVVIVFGAHIAKGRQSSESKSTVTIMYAK